MHQHRWAWKPVVEFIIMTASEIEMGYLLGVSHAGNTHTELHLPVLLCYYYYFSDRSAKPQIFSCSPLVIHRAAAAAVMAVISPAAARIIYGGNLVTSTCSFQTGCRSEYILKSSKPNSPKWLRQPQTTGTNGKTDSLGEKWTEGKRTREEDREEAKAGRALTNNLVLWVWSFSSFSSCHMMPLVSDPQLELLLRAISPSSSTFLH